MEALERDAIVRSLEDNANNKLQAAIALGMSRVNRPGESGDSSSWEGWSHVRWFVEEVPAGAA